VSMCCLANVATYIQKLLAGWYRKLYVFRNIGLRCLSRR